MDDSALSVEMLGEPGRLRRRFRPRIAGRGLTGDDVTTDDVGLADFGRGRFEEVEGSSKTDEI